MNDKSGNKFEIGKPVSLLSGCWIVDAINDFAREVHIVNRLVEFAGQWVSVDSVELMPEKKDRNGNELKVGDRVSGLWNRKNQIGIIVRFEISKALVSDTGTCQCKWAGWYPVNELELIPSPDPLAEATKAVVEAARKQAKLHASYCSAGVNNDKAWDAYLDAALETNDLAEKLEAIEAQ